MSPPGMPVTDGESGFQNGFQAARKEMKSERISVEIRTAFGGNRVWPIGEG